jgi:hypothetical protein
LKSKIPGAKDHLNPKFQVPNSKFQINPKSQASNSKKHAKGRQEPESRGRMIYSVLHKHYGIEKYILFQWGITPYIFRIFSYKNKSFIL